jgi:predicted O-methyltransferase YrrM
MRLVSVQPPTGNDAEHLDTVEFVRGHTMTSPARVQALCDAAQYVARHRIPGAVVECGVWKGGSMMAVARTLAQAGAADRDLYLFDTFEGMTPPTDEDRDVHGRHARDRLDAASEEEHIWAKAPLDGVKAAMRSTGYPESRIHFVVGRVEDTVPAGAPPQIALLRLDTDWYESTRHEWEHLYPRVAQGGVIIVDDYGHWQGARKATDEYLAASKARLLLNRVDSEGRIAVKLDP